MSTTLHNQLEFSTKLKDDWSRNSAPKTKRLLWSHREF
jgi:hypothetical protein